MKFFFLCMLIASLALIFTGAARAHGPCGPKDVVIKQYQEKGYDLVGETTGPSDKGPPVKVYRFEKPDTREWAIFYNPDPSPVQVNPILCFAALGNEWRVPESF